MDKLPIPVMVDVARVVVSETLKPDGIYISPDEARRWLDFICEVQAMEVCVESATVVA